MPDFAITLLTIILIRNDNRRMYICICKGITESDIRDAVADGACSVGDLHDQLGVASGCGSCACVAQDVLEDARTECGVRGSGAAAAHNSLHVSR